MPQLSGISHASFANYVSDTFTRIRNDIGAACNRFKGCNPFRNWSISFFSRKKEVSDAVNNNVAFRPADQKAARPLHTYDVLHVKLARLIHGDGRLCA